MRKNTSPAIPKLLKITRGQLSAIVDATDMLSAMEGTGGDGTFDRDVRRTVKAIDRFLKANGLKRTYN